MANRKILTSAQQIEKALKTYYTKENIQKGICDKEYEKSYLLGWLKSAYDTIANELQERINHEN